MTIAVNGGALNHLNRLYPILTFLDFHTWLAGMCQPQSMLSTCQVVFLSFHRLVLITGSFVVGPYVENSMLSCFGVFTKIFVFDPEIIQILTMGSRPSNWGRGNESLLT